jgi:phosphoribosylformylglycinamidine synthase I
MKFGVLVFPGSNCDHDTYNVIGSLLQEPVTFLWHASEDLEGCDAILVPGGFAYGDYLRTGAIAKFAPVMQSVQRFAANGGLVMGICNGFQILCEAGLLPGALMRNAHQHYVCKQVHLRTETTNSPFTSGLDAAEVLTMPVGHMEGNYFCLPLHHTAGRVDGRGQSQRIARKYRWRAQRGPQRPRPDAAPGPLQRVAAWLRRRHSPVPGHGPRARHRLAPPPLLQRTSTRIGPS